MTDLESLERLLKNDRRNLDAVRNGDEARRIAADCVVRWKQARALGEREPILTSEFNLVVAANLMERWP